MLMKIFVLDESDSANFGKQLLGGVACEKNMNSVTGVVEGRNSSFLSW